MWIETKAILKRNTVSGYKVSVVKSDIQQMTTDTYNPYHPITPGNLVRFLIYLHDKKGWQPRRQFNLYYQDARRLIEEVGPEEAERLMLEAYGKSKHPWGFEFINKLKGPSKNEINIDPFNH